MDVSVSFNENGPISLQLKHVAPIHIHIMMPFSLLVKDFDPNTTQVPNLERRRSWLATRLFGRRYETPVDVMTKIFLLTCPAFHNLVWPKLSTLLFGKEEPMMYSHLSSDKEEWERARASTVSWAFSTRITDDDIGDMRAVILKASPNPDGPGGILFTVEEMGEREKAAWKTAWKVLVPPTPSPSDGESDVDLAMARKNNALCRLKAGWVALPISNKKESFESV